MQINRPSSLLLLVNKNKEIIILKKEFKVLARINLENTIKINKAKFSPSGDRVLA